MARPREFDEDLALERAMDVFWRQGYQATSTDDLMEAMGIGRGSFYNTFGSKRKVYLRTLDMYLDVLEEGGPYRMLREMEPGGKALQALLGSYLESVGSDTGNHGCYFVHVAKEHRGADPEIQKAIRVGVARMKAILTDHMKIAQGQGILPEHIEPSQAALLMMAVAWGSHVLLEAGVEQDEAMSAARVVFDMGREPV
ncbi:MAG: TetR/AcrR family transcriptional regulator [Longimicrobiales bacterium]